ncbi:MAG: hypothetical protein JNL42_05405 [Anaerolineae bacterium]|nr:hypothetical protein [Anaerolineae bacterium]
MSHRLALLSCFIFLGLLLGGTLGAGAQQNIYIAHVPDVAVTHILRYTDSSADAARRAQALIMQVIPTYTLRWKAPIEEGVELPFGIYLDLAPAAAEPMTFDYFALPDATGGSPLQPNAPTDLYFSCRITLTDVRDPVDPEAFDYQLALAMARCYPYAYTRGVSHETMLDPAQSWWFDGVTTWMVLDAMGRLPAGVIGDIQADYIDNHQDALYTLGRESLYFWEALADLEYLPTDFISRVSSIDVLPSVFTGRRLDDMSGIEDFDQQFMVTYAQALMQGGIPNQPAVDDLLDTSEQITSLPASIDLEQPPFSVRLMEIALSGIEDKMGVQVSLTPEAQVDSRRTQVFLLSADGPVVLSGGESYQFCYSAAMPPLRLQISRASVGDEFAFSTLQFSQTQPCEDKLEAPACLYGVWNITDFSAFPFKPSGIWQIIFSDDGTGVVVAEELALGPKDTDPVIVNYVITLTMTLEQDESLSPSEVRVVDWSADMQPGASAYVVMPGGRTMDMTSAVVGGADAANNQMPPPLYIACDSPNAARMVMSAGGAQYTFTLERAS